MFSVDAVEVKQVFSFCHVFGIQTNFRDVFFSDGVYGYFGENGWVYG
jgi:hypothetical protein